MGFSLSCNKVTIRIHVCTPSQLRSLGMVEGSLVSDVLGCHSFVLPGHLFFKAA